MRVLIRHIIRSPGGIVERSDTEFEGETLSVGRATDQTIHIPNKGLPLEHSEILVKGKYLSIRANPGCMLFVNGEQVDQARLDPGDLINIGNHRLMISDPTGAFDQVILVEPGDEEEEEVLLSASMVTQLENTGLSKRRWSWISIGVILLLGLVIPGLGFVSPSLASMLRDTPLTPDDGQWDSGPLHPSHQAIGDDCSQCHGTPFQMVPDEKCVACHSFVEHHVDPAMHKIAKLEETRCASCHKEHNEPTALLRRDQAHCVDCHGDLGAQVSGTPALRNVEDFGDNHPEFRVTMLRPVGAGRDTSWETVRLGLDEAGTREQSNLKFPHALHLNPKGIRTSFGGVAQPGSEKVVMVCADCHRPDPSGAYMETVTMEAHCASCHKLQFDPRALDREVPHGNPDVVVRTLQEFYARLYLLNQVSPVGGAPHRAARRPGSVSLPPEGRSLMLSWAQTQANDAAADLFERRVCKDCHVVSVKPDAAHLSPWQVNPVNLTRVWLPKSFFEHSRHTTYDCVECHGTEGSDGKKQVTSKESGDILLPRIGVCRDCHSGENSSTMLASTCIDCHRFHIPGMDVMKPWVAGARRKEPDSDMQRLKREGL